MKEKGLNKTFGYLLAFSIVIGFYWLLINVAEMNPSSAMRDTFIMIIGVIVGKFSTIVDFYWGSSSGSNEKNDLLKKKEEDKNGGQ